MTGLTNRAVLLAALVLVSIFAHHSSTTELHNVDPHEHDADLHLLPQMPLTARLYGNESIETSGAGLLARYLLGKHQCPAGTGLCSCRSLGSLRIFQAQLTNPL